MEGKGLLFLSLILNHSYYPINAHGGRILTLHTEEKKGHFSLSNKTSVWGRKTDFLKKLMLKMQQPKPQLDPKQTVVQRCPLRSNQHKGQTTKGGFSPYFHLQRIKARPLVPELGGRGEHEDVCF